MDEINRRRHPRCVKNTAIIYSFLNQTKQHEAIASNYSRSGMYFEAQKSLAPGTLILVRYDGCNPAADPETAPVFCSGDTAASEACQELKTQVTAEVKRCEKLEEATKSRFGIAVKYISPAV